MADRDTPLRNPASRRRVPREKRVRVKSALTPAQKRELVEYFEDRVARLDIIETTKTPSGQMLDWIDIRSQHPDGLIASPPPAQRAGPRIFNQAVSKCSQRRAAAVLVARDSVMNEAALTSWLMEVEEAFGNFVKVFELLAAGKQPAPDQIARVLEASRAYESQAKQMRSLIMNPGDSVM